MLVKRPFYWGRKLHVGRFVMAMVRATTDPTFVAPRLDLRDLVAGEPTPFMRLIRTPVGRADELVGEPADCAIERLVGRHERAKTSAR